MGKAAAGKKTTNTESNAQNYMAALDIQQRFIGEAFGLGWRLIITFLVPVLFGAWLDSRFDTKPSYTLVGIFIAIAASITIIRRTVKDIAIQPVKTAKRKKRA
jgi:F0F1-type ATP synthase assembly protein I